MKFSKLYEDVKASDLFKPASPEEIDKRSLQYIDIRIKEELDSVKKTKLPDGTWHVHETLNFYNEHVNSFKNLNVSIVDGSFWCNYHKVLSFSKLSSLEGCPKTVRGDFNCHGNNITSLKDGPEHIGGSFNCSSNKLTSLEDAPTYIGLALECKYNSALTSLKGAPKVIHDDFICNTCRLTSLIGAPEKIEGIFDFSNNNINSLEGCPKHVDGNFTCYENERVFSEDEIKKICKVGGRIHTDIDNSF